MRKGFIRRTMLDEISSTLMSQKRVQWSSGLKKDRTCIFRVNTVGTIFWYLWFPLDFFDETFRSYVIEVEKKYPEVELPVGGRTSGFQEKHDIRLFDNL